MEIARHVEEDQNQYTAIEHWALVDLVALTQYVTPCLLLVKQHEKLCIPFNVFLTGNIIVRRVLPDPHWMPHSACIHLFQESYCIHCVKPIL